jgi:hypothetical protein
MRIRLKNSAQSNHFFSIASRFALNSLPAFPFREFVAIGDLVADFEQKLKILHRARKVPGGIKICCLIWTLAVAVSAIGRKSLAIAVFLSASKSSPQSATIFFATSSVIQERARQESCCQSGNEKN